jgi:hypothetical protein
MRHSSLCLLAAFTLLLLAPGDASAKDLRGKFGLGFNNNFTSLTSISIKGGLPMPKPTQNLQVQGLVGFGLARAEPARMFVGGRVLIPILAEDNLNLYAGVGGGYLRLRPEGQTEILDAFRGQAVLGVEFFFFGLDELGFSAEVGINFDVAEEFLSFSTTSGTAANVGVHYYFGKKK